MNPVVDGYVSDVNRVVGSFRTALYAGEAVSHAFKAFGDALQEFNRSFPSFTKLAVTVNHVVNFVDFFNPGFTGFRIWQGSRKPRMWALLIVHLELFASVTSRWGFSPFGEVPALAFNISMVALSVLNIRDRLFKFDQIEASVKAAAAKKSQLQSIRDPNLNQSLELQYCRNCIGYASYKRKKVRFAIGEDVSKLFIATLNIAASAFALPQKNLMLASVAVLAAGAMGVSLVFKVYYDIKTDGAKKVKRCIRST
jgi:hypothetical protein